MVTQFARVYPIIIVMILLVATPAVGQEEPPGLETIATGLGFTEGPAADPDGRLYFTDIPRGRIHRLEQDGTISIWLEDPGKCNGLMFNADGILYACRFGGNEVVRIDPVTREVVPIASRYGGNPFITPNDLVLDSAGGLYFTDPDYGRGSDPPQDKEAVYYRDAEGSITRLVDDLKRPNGVILSPDEQTLYVLPSGEPQLMAYPVLSPGRTGPGRVLAELAHGGDGMAVDVTGNLYLTQPRGRTIEVIDSTGKHLETISLPKGPSNCAFGGPLMKTLYITARDTVYALPREAAGHRFPGISIDSGNPWREASSFLDGLDDAQRTQVLFAMDDPLREQWSYFPRVRPGLPLGTLSGVQQAGAERLIRASLSDGGARKVDLLRSIEPVRGPAGSPTMGPDAYSVMIFGTPGPESTWGWRLEGHHLVLNTTVVGGHLAAGTPMFFGASPARVTGGTRDGLRVLHVEEDVALDLLRSLTPEQRKEAVLSTPVPGNILSDTRAVASPVTRAGLPGSAMTDDQYAALIDLVEEYVGMQPSVLADSVMEQVRSVDGGGLTFAWIGGDEVELPHYYRIHGPGFLIEFYNGNSDVNHIHAVWRDLEGDFGRADLAREGDS